MDGGAFAVTLFDFIWRTAFRIGVGLRTSYNTMPRSLLVLPSRQRSAGLNRTQLIASTPLHAPSSHISFPSAQAQASKIQTSGCSPSVRVDWLRSTVVPQTHGFSALRSRFPTSSVWQQLSKTVYVQAPKSHTAAHTVAKRFSVQWWSMEVSTCGAMYVLSESGCSVLSCATSKLQRFTSLSSPQLKKVRPSVSTASPRTKPACP